MKTIAIPLIDIFKFPSIKGLTEEFINKHPGDIPVYGGKMTETPIGYVKNNLPDVKYFYDCLAWNREGSVGYVFYHKHKFSTNDHQRPLILKDKYKRCINLEYVRIVLQQFLLSQGFVWSKTASKEKVQKMAIDLPVNDSGEIDLLLQNEYVKRYQRIENAQKKLSNYRNSINESIVVVKKPNATKTIYLSDEYFRLSIGKRILKKELSEEGIPVYSANPNKLFGYVKKSNLKSFALDSIIWGIDGEFEWGYIPHNYPFATTDHCGRLEVLNNKILSDYVYYQLRESASSYGFNRTFRASLENIKSVSIEVPVNGNNEFDTLVQSELVNKYKNIDAVKIRLSQLLDSVVNPQIEV